MILLLLLLFELQVVPLLTDANPISAHRCLQPISASVHPVKRSVAPAVLVSINQSINRLLLVF